MKKSYLTLKSGARFVCLCAPNDLAQAYGSDLLASFKAIGVDMIVAGKGLVNHAEHEIYAGCDMAASLTEMVEALS